MIIKPKSIEFCCDRMKSMVLFHSCQWMMVFDTDPPSWWPCLLTPSEIRFSHCPYCGAKIKIYANNSTTVKEDDIFEKEE